MKKAKPSVGGGGGGGNNMSKTTDFVGFSDDDAVKSTLQEKLAKFKAFKLPGVSQHELQHHKQNQTLPPAQNKRPQNRFLKRNDSISSTSSLSPVKISLVSPSEPKPSSSTAIPPVKKTLKLQQNLTSAKDSSTSISTTTPVPVPSSSSSVSLNSPLSLPVDDNKPQRKEKEPAAAVATDTLPSTTASPNINVEVAKSRRPSGSKMKTANKQASPVKRTTSVSEFSFLPGQSSRSKRTIVPNKRFFSVDSPPPPLVSKQSDSSSCSSNNIELPQKQMNIIPKSPSKKSVSHAKGSPPAPTSPLKKRTIVPNKRFFSVDSPPPSFVSKQSDSSSSSSNNIELPQKQMNIIPKSHSKKSVSHAKGSPPAPTSPLKKRSISGDGVKVKTEKINRKRKLSAEIPTVAMPKSSPPVTNGSTTVHPVGLSGMPADSLNGNATESRPRRTIIPNRKFLDDESAVVMSKEPLARKEEGPELKRKRRKSEKSSLPNSNKISDNGLPLQPLPHLLPPVQISNSTPPVRVKNGPTTNTSSLVKEISGSGAKPMIPIPAINTIPQDVFTSVLNGSNFSSPPAPETHVQVEVNVNQVPIIPQQALIDADIKVEEKPAVTPAPELKNDDVIPLDEVEAERYRAKTMFLGTCIIKAVDQQKDQVCGGIICCGVCNRIKKYRQVIDKRKRGSFLCTDCVDIVENVFKMALKAKPFSCITGPPICEGACPLVINVTDQFCQACFAKTCLKNLPMKDDVYFKVWRAIPPMSRGTVPTTPKVNPASPHVGKVAVVDENGVIVSTTGSLKVLVGAKKPNGGAQQSEDSSVASSEDSNSTSEVLTNRNGDGDLNSARITTFSHRPGPSLTSNMENAVPLKISVGESLLLAPSSCSSSSVSSSSASTTLVATTAEQLKETLTKSNGVAKEELIYCSLCCEPFHPYCAGDDLLLDSYIDRCNNSDQKDEKSLISNVGGVTNDPSKIVLKWTCRQCLSCKSCGDSIGRSELIRCNRCQNPYHLKDGCIDKQILSKVKDRSKLKKVWTCDVCMNCKSCGKRIESNRRVKTIQEVAAQTEDSSSEMSEEEEEDGGEDVTSKSQINCLMLCLDCFKQRKKGSYCPVCEVCYDDNDWDCKMMECVKCNRWIHSTCENLSDEQYHILGTLPGYIEYICKICRGSSASSIPLWYEAVQTLLSKGCNSAIQLFEQKSLGTLSRKRTSSTDNMKPSFVCNLFDDGIDKKINLDSKDSDKDNEIEIIIITTDEGNEVGVQVQENQVPKEDTPKKVTLRVIKDGDELDKHDKAEENRNFRRDMIRSVSYKEMMNCKVKLRDFINYPTTLEENWYALKALGVEILCEWDATYMNGGHCLSSKEPTTPIHITPKTVFFTPSKRISGIANALKSIGSVTSLCVFQNAVVKAIEKNCGDNEDEKMILLKHARNAIQETFPWFEQNFEEMKVKKEVEMKPDVSRTSFSTDDNSMGDEVKYPGGSDPFQEIYWDSKDFLDNRACLLCGELGDFPPQLCGRLLWCGDSEWIHCNCAIWSSEVFELESGALKQVGGALNRAKQLKCKVCGKKGATVSCCHSNCKNSYHFLCAMEAKCYLMEDKTMFCSHHKLKPEQLDAIQEDMKVGRKVFVDLDWIQKRGIKSYSNNIKLFVGSLKINNLGTIVPISVAPKQWSSSGDTLLVPLEFESQRIFWSLKNPWVKECYHFQTGISRNGFPHATVQDVGVNLVVDHCNKKKDIISRRMEDILRFHSWIRKAPRYVDEEGVEWLPPCFEEFSLQVSEDDEDSESGIDNQMIIGGAGGGRSSPSSVSSLGSFRQVPARNLRKRNSNPYSFRRPLPGPGEDSSAPESVHTGYASSVDSETSKSVRGTRQMKRRRSSCKNKRPRKRPKIGSSSKYESPRRQSMRNRCWNSNKVSEESQKKEEIESDTDSGMMGSCSSTAGNGDEDRLSCRVNLSQFNISFEEEQENNSSNASPDDKANTKEDRIMEMDNVSLVSSSVILEEHGGSLLSSSQISDADIATATAAEIYSASICFRVKRNQNIYICDSSDARQAWMFLFEEVCKTRRLHNLPELVHPSTKALAKDSEDISRLEVASSFRMLGVSHRSVQYLMEQLPGISCVVEKHKFMYSHRPYVDKNDENAVVPHNSTGSARSEGFRGRKPFDMFGWLASRHRKVSFSCHIPEDSSRSQGLPLAMQFRDLKVKARKRFVVMHSEIHGRGLFARVDVEKGEMLIEYAGEVIRPSLSDPRERYYESKGIGCYMFRIKTQVIDATLKGNAARFINHSCEPNCEAKTVRILGKDHIIIFALRKIFKGEELTYDYKFEREEDKIPCSCGASRCRKYMN